MFLIIHYILLFFLSSIIYRLFRNHHRFKIPILIYNPTSCIFSIPQTMICITQKQPQHFMFNFIILQKLGSISFCPFLFCLDSSSLSSLSVHSLPKKFSDITIIANLAFLTPFNILSFQLSPIQ